MAKNYYLILGTTADASREDIKAAFRRRAFELHPDRSGLESAPFQDVQEAYTVLGDSERRRHYDRDYRSSMAERRDWRKSTAEPMAAKRPRGEPFRPADAAREFLEMSLADSFEVYRPSFEEMFTRLWSNFERASRPKSEQLASLTVEIVLDAEDAARGGQVRVWIPARATCPACGGHGAVGPYECWRCEGHGVQTTECPIDVDYPAGLRDGYATRISLERFGIQNLHLVVLLRVNHAASA